MPEIGRASIGNSPDFNAKDSLSPLTGMSAFHPFRTLAACPLSTQSRRDAAIELGAHEDEQRWEENVKRVAKQKAEDQAEPARPKS